MNNRRIDWGMLEYRLRTVLQLYRNDVIIGNTSPFLTLHRIDEILTEETGRGPELVASQHEAAVCVARNQGG